MHRAVLGDGQPHHGIPWFPFLVFFPSLPSTPPATGLPRLCTDPLKTFLCQGPDGGRQAYATLLPGRVGGLETLMRPQIPGPPYSAQVWLHFPSSKAQAAEWVFFLGLSQQGTGTEVCPSSASAVHCTRSQKHSCSGSQGSSSF